MNKELGMASDWAQSHQKCGSELQRTTSNNRQNEKPEFKDILGDEFNIAWKAIQKNGFLSRDNQLAEFFMTVSGTIISQARRRSLRDENAALKKRRFHSPLSAYQGPCPR